MKKPMKSLNEELKKFQKIIEYNHYTPENYHEDDLSIVMEDEPEMGDEDGMGTEPEMGGEDDMGNEPEMGGEDEMVSEPETGDEDEMVSEPETGDEVEIDITQLVQGTEDAKMLAQQSNQKIDMLMNQFDELTNKISNIDNISNRIEGLSAEMEKRLPTDQEKLEMRSLSSYPYNQKLTDYWFDKEGTYDVMGNKEENKPKEYVLTKNDVDSGYSDGKIKASFNSNNDNEFEEEDI